MYVFSHLCADEVIRAGIYTGFFQLSWHSKELKICKYLPVILRGRGRCELIYITNEAVGRVGYYQLISGKSEKNNCFSKFQAILLISSGETSSNRAIFFTDDAAKIFF